MATMMSRSNDELCSKLGGAIAIWNTVIEDITARVGPVEQEWKPSKSDFGQMCLLKLGKRTLLYMTPEQGHVRIAIVLGERAAAIALESGLQDEIKELIRDARLYAEGRGITFSIDSLAEVDTVIQLIDAKTTPK